MLEYHKSDTPNFDKELLKSSVSITENLDGLTLAVHQPTLIYKPNPGLSIFPTLKISKYKLLKSPVQMPQFL